jgi:NAD(P)H dehydrogenase (quinone)
MTEMIHAVIIFDSKTGNTAKAASYIAEGLEKSGHIKVSTFKIPDVDVETVKAADVVIFGAPTYMASLTGDMTSWLQKEGHGLNLAGKLGGAFATAQYIHGGADLVIQTLLTHAMVFGMMVYSGGSAKGKPVIHLGPVGMSPKMEDFADLFRTYGERMAEQAEAIYKK